MSRGIVWLGTIICFIVGVFAAYKLLMLAPLNKADIDKVEEAVQYRITVLGPYSKFVFYTDKINLWSNCDRVTFTDVRGIKCHVRFDFIEALTDIQVAAPEVTLDDEVENATSGVAIEDALIRRVK